MDFNEIDYLKFTWTITINERTNLQSLLPP